jgi:hypothetical protein
MVLNELSVLVWIISHLNPPNIDMKTLLNRLSVSTPLFALLAACASGAASTGPAADSSGIGATGPVDIGGAPAAGAPGTGSVGTTGATGTSVPGAGAPSTGGIVSVSGAAGVSGSIAAGGNAGTGGSKVAGGTAGTGGSKATGGSAGPAGGQCTWSAGPSNSSGHLTCYWFGQGTAQGDGCPSYKTYCGYCGTESGSGSGACPSGITDTVTNIANSTYFAALPASTLGSTGAECGQCVSVSYGGKTIVATVIDLCGTCTSSNWVDLSLPAAAALGLTGGAGEATSGVTWSSTDCPVTGNIKAVTNNGYGGQYYFQNVAFPVKSVTVGGRTGTQSQYAYWDFGAAVSGSATLSDGVHTVTGNVPSGGGDIGVQFPLTCQ